MQGHVVPILAKVYNFLYNLCFPGSHQNNIEGRGHALSDWSLSSNHTHRLFPVEFPSLHSQTYIPHSVNIGVSDIYLYEIKRKHLRNDDAYSDDGAMNVVNTNGKTNKLFSSKF